MVLSNSLMRKSHALARGQPPAIFKDGAEMDRWALHSKDAQKTLQDVLYSSRIELDYIDFQVLSLKSKLNALLNRRTEVIERIDYCGRAMSPEKRLPPELLSEIFVHCLEGKPIEIPSKDNARRMPWTLTLVSRRWRAIALGEPRIWNSFQVFYGRSAPGRITALAYSQMAFSGRSLVRLTAEDYIGDNLTDLVSPVSDRLKTLSLRFAERTIPSVLHSTTSSFSALESLELVVSGRSADRPPPRSFPHLHDSPNLRQVIIRTLAHSTKSSILRDCTPYLPWAQLTNLAFENVVFPASRWLEVLTLCVELESVVMELFPTGETLQEFVDMERVTLPRLTSMRLIDKGSLLFPHFIDNLTLPALQILKMIFYTNDGAIGPLVSLFARSACPLTGMSLCLPSMSVDNFDRITHLLPTLRYLSLIGATIPTLFLPRLVEGKILPFLEDLAYCPKSLESFLDILEGQWEVCEQDGRAWPGPRQIRVHNLAPDFDIYLVDPKRIQAMRAKFARHGLRFEVIE